MGHSVKLDEIYYDENIEESRKQIMLEYMKAVDALTINDEFRLRKQIAEYKDKLENVPKVEKLQEQLASRIIEQESMKTIVEKLQREKELQDQYYRKRETEMNQKMDKLRSDMNFHFDKLRSAKKILARSNNGMIDRSWSILDSRRRFTMMYEDDNKKLITLKIPMNDFEILDRSPEDPILY